MPVTFDLVQFVYPLKCLFLGLLSIFNSDHVIVLCAPLGFDLLAHVGFRQLMYVASLWNCLILDIITAFALGVRIRPDCVKLLYQATHRFVLMISL